MGLVGTYMSGFIKELTGSFSLTLTPILALQEIGFILLVASKKKNP